MAQTNLGSMYYDGQGAPQDDLVAYKWSDYAQVAP